MSDGFMLYLDDDGVARHYDDTYDITIHCESEEEQRRAVEIIKSKQWIPCSERLPEHGERYLISVLDGINRRTTVAPYLPRCKTWAMTGRMAYWKVIAWMPLPEPYKEDDHETD